MTALEGIGVGVRFCMESDIRDDIAAGCFIRVLQDWTPPLAPLRRYYSSRHNPSAVFKAFSALPVSCGVTS